MDTPTPISTPLDRESLIERIRDELCIGSIDRHVPAWGPMPKNGENGVVKSWTDTISKNIGSARHYITCFGSRNKVPCLGRWSRRYRQRLSPGLYCIFGSWVTYDGNVITECVDENSRRTLVRLRNLWAEHVLQPGMAGTIAQDKPSSRPLLNEVDIETIYARMSEAIGRSKEQRSIENEKGKLLGNGQGGWDGMVKGIVMKRDRGSQPIGNRHYRCHREPGRYFGSDDLEIWSSAQGWANPATRDGRFHPGYQLEVLLFLLTGVIDYGGNRSIWRNRDLPWTVATEWIWMDTPLDVSVRFAEGCKLDCNEMLRREVERRENISPETYCADNSCDRETQHTLLLDRAGEMVTRFTCGDCISTDRGYIVAWMICAANDIVDYERDVFVGETNNLVRGLTSTQQVVDAAYTMLLLIEGALVHEDYDIPDSFLGLVLWYLQCWRYNTAKQFAYYEPRSVRDHGFSQPPETSELLGIAKMHYSSQNWGDLYGELYDRLESRLKELYWGCTCDSKPEGHENWELMSRSLNGKADEQVEQEVIVSLFAICTGATHGDIRCECPLDLSLHMTFVHFFHPENGIVPRMHYRTNVDGGNTMTE
ncbi:hypothetical protein FE257_005674 [Aspergillus nanangensis]|uniref:Uncharacterized protein n=1 Tax=Aspergillus nanangensis TaxID=2582783 RepID=A0AAD4CQH6_ASPNN|nr:hypothetical protein FE257_005674 [Aspergillus nanangensis]